MDDFKQLLKGLGKQAKAEQEHQQQRMLDEMIANCLQCLQQAAAKDNPLIAIMSMQPFSEEDIWNKMF